MEVFLDSSFIVSCMRRKIDFVSELEEKGFKVIVPREVLQELKDLKVKKNTPREDRKVIELAMGILESRKVNKKRIGSGIVDEALIKKGQEGVYIATLDKEIKRQVKNRVVINNAKNSIEIERD